MTTPTIRKSHKPQNMNKYLPSRGLSKKQQPVFHIYSIVLSKGVDGSVIIPHQLFSIAILRQSVRHMALLCLTYISAPQMASFNVEEAWCKECKVTGFL